MGALSELGLETWARRTARTGPPWLPVGAHLRPGRGLAVYLILDDQRRDVVLQVQWVDLPVQQPRPFVGSARSPGAGDAEWVEKSYPNLTYFNEVDKGGHFAAWEEPQLFAVEMRAAFRSLR
jgi:pimeloyl-ACP methyl ester carboxylesterase